MEAGRQRKENDKDDEGNDEEYSNPLWPRDVIRNQNRVAGLSLVCGQVHKLVIDEVVNAGR